VNPDDVRTTELPTQGRTVELGVPGPTVALHRPPRRSGFWRELSGALAAGVVVLAVVVLALQVVSLTRDVPGMGVWVLVGHVAGAVAAVVLQRQVDRRDGRASLLAGLGLGVVVAAVLVLFWWA
jgi:anti-sigma-K factor RskA